MRKLCLTVQQRQCLFSFRRGPLDFWTLTTYYILYYYVNICICIYIYMRSQASRSSCPLSRCVTSGLCFFDRLRVCPTIAVIFVICHDGISAARRPNQLFFAPMMQPSTQSSTSWLRQLDPQPFCDSKTHVCKTVLGIAIEDFLAGALILCPGLQLSEGFPVSLRVASVA